MKHHFSAGVYIKQQHLPVGYCVDTHVHAYDHFGLLGAGIASVEVNGLTTKHQGPCVIEIKSGTKHKITALTSIDWFCIHATDETDVSRIDEVLTKKE